MGVVILGGLWFGWNKVRLTNSRLPSPTPDMSGVEPSSTSLEVVAYTGEYRDSQAGFRLKFPGTMYVVRGQEETYPPPEEGEPIYSEAESYATIQIGYDQNLESGIQINYGKPVLDGKGGACMTESGENAWKTVMLNGVGAESSCEYTIAYPVHPNKRIEYLIVPHGNEAETKQYYDLILTGWQWL
ncbi:hypothetical protein A2187_02310 [Candidatus Collierbacteria bacterium RIFOXYA1_FULL_46_24]|uniref:Uncharacterized protein n=2 Tax=Candidatus Collieribacteriota TaxID=1752725 RepID=A0A1F5FYS7_9BACT|nr:MAG: hypothetical protein A2187_02310 [Candidatus Collierbacteria bacterium RIFOXYA1_FULL_46_24]OGD74222.1 MAG: hypothetical protein A2228_03650 [Candidatus Collierbacteria bacterium RIFOXYA2_FULL_46_10]OGD84714.1 MAG: hypothetical protein A2618_02140 [Candidatus Collierbacteria bacterium RIFOXYD1_FULL_46_26]HBD02294.1 hypothetical protein [Candidatus Collierbacteria bacterium]